ncbi:MAG: hypothetical protein MZV64_20900 [Ignavibacteriales bacterium]|nr:hypothetical protein [Ignavibacteriales bacterium]
MRQLHAAHDREAHPPPAGGGRTGAMVGMISIGDLVRAVIEEQDQTIEHLETLHCGLRGHDRSVGCRLRPAYPAAGSCADFIYNPACPAPLIRPGRRFLRSPKLASPIVLLSGLRRLRRGVHAGRGLLEPRRRRHRAEGHDARAAARQPGAPRLRDADGHAQRHRPAEPRRRLRGRRDPADARLHRDALLRQRLRLDDRGLRRGHAPLRRFADRRDRDQHLLPEHQGGRRAVRQRRPTCRRAWSTRAARVTKKPLITKLSPNQTDIRENARRCIEAGSDALAVINTDDGHGDRREDAQAGHRQHPGRPLRAGDQADRAAQGDAGRRGRAAARRADHRPGRHLQRATTRSSSSSPARRPSASARRCSTSRTGLQAASMPASPRISRRTAWSRSAS